jgi:hypothetical protein
LCDACPARAGGLSPPLFEGAWRRPWRREGASAASRGSQRWGMEFGDLARTCSALCSRYAACARRGKALLVAMQSKAMASTTTAPEGKSSMADTARPIA